jgi:hypothetical protein
MRAIAEEAFAMVKEYKGSHSGEHGDGLVRSEFHELMYGSRTVRLFEEVKDRFDPGGLMNPGKIVRALAHERPHAVPLQAGLSRGLIFEPRSTGRPIPAQGAVPGAVEMCNNNGECRKHVGSVMCPSSRVTGNERDLTARGRANTLRLAISGPARPRRLRLRRDARDHEAVRLLQGLPARMPDRRRHGRNEDRGAGRRQPAAAASPA